MSAVCRNAMFEATTKAGNSKMTKQKKEGKEREKRERDREGPGEEGEMDTLLLTYDTAW